MNDAVVLPEMLEMGLEALSQATDANLTPSQTVIEVYLAMEGARQIFLMRQGSTVH